MSAMTLAVGQDYFARNDAIRRRNAEAAYNRAEKYNGDISAALEKLERLITGENDPNKQQITQPREQKLDAGQLKQVSIPTGKTLEETIDLWRGVRTDALSVPDPKTADYQLASVASSKIRETEAQLGLEQRMKSSFEETNYNSISNPQLPPTDNWNEKELQQRFERAQSSYSFQVDMEKRGFVLESPTIFEVA